MEGREHHDQASGSLGDGGLIFSPSPWQEERAGAQGPAPIQLAARLRFGLCSGFWPHALVVAVKPAWRAQPMVSYLGPLGKKMAILSAVSSAWEWSWLTLLRRGGSRPRHLVLLRRKPRGRWKPAPRPYLSWACSRQIVQFSKESQRASLCDPITRVGVAFFNFGGLVGRRGCEGRQPDLHRDLQHPNLILTLPTLCSHGVLVIDSLR